MDGTVCKKVSGEDLVEVILKTRVEHRLMGFYWPKTARHQFTIVLPCNHKGKVYNPKDALDTTRKRIREVQQGLVGIRRCVRPK